VSSLTASLDPRGRREQGLYAALHTRGSNTKGAAGAMTGSPDLFGAALAAAMAPTAALPGTAAAMLPTAGAYTLSQFSST